jgi:putative membrane protein
MPEPGPSDMVAPSRRSNAVKLNDPKVLDRIEQAVSVAEKSTSAEFVVVITPQSGSYLDREILFGTVVGLLALAFFIFSPGDFHPALAFVDFLIAFGVGTLLCNRSIVLKRLVVRSGRQEKNVRAGLRISFMDEGVGATLDRTGVLIYVSILERTVRILPDFGVEGKVGEAPWNRIQKDAGAPAPGVLGDVLIRVIEEAGKVLAPVLPPGEENPDEIPNRPRILGS